VRSGIATDAKNKLCKKLIPLVTSGEKSVQNNTLGIRKEASTFERAMTGRVMHSIAFLTLCAAYIQGGLSKLSNIAGSLAEMDGFRLRSVCRSSAQPMVT
jgi:hypothetical protein